MNQPKWICNRNCVSAKPSDDDHSFEGNVCKRRVKHCILGIAHNVELLLAACACRIRHSVWNKISLSFLILCWNVARSGRGAVVGVVAGCWQISI